MQLLPSSRELHKNSKDNLKKIMSKNRDTTFFVAAGELWCSKNSSMTTSNVVCLNVTISGTVIQIRTNSELNNCKGILYK